MVKNNLIEERPSYFWKFILAFIIGTVIFILIFIISYSISYSKLGGIFESQEQIKNDISLFNFEKDSVGLGCKNFSVYRFTSDMDRIGVLIGVLEERLGKTNSRVLAQKETYSLLEIRHLAYIRDYNQYCRGNISAILFFYSNQEPFKDKSDHLGYVLTTLKNKNPEVMIYSFDYDLNASIISSLIQKYNVTGPNRLVINEKTQNSSLRYMEEIERLLE